LVLRDIYDSAIQSVYVPKTAEGTVDPNFISIWELWAWLLLALRGYGKEVRKIFSVIPADKLTSAKRPSEALINLFTACKLVIDTGCSAMMKKYMAMSIDDLINIGIAKNWTPAEVMRQINKVVGKQHALDGKLFEACIAIVMIHFLGKELVKIRTQERTGSRFGGLSDIIVYIGAWHCILEAKTKLGSDWKRHVLEHLVPKKDEKGDVVRDSSGKIIMTQEPYFLVAPSFELKGEWVDEMLASNCQPVSVSESPLLGVVSFDSVIDALRVEINKNNSSQTKMV
jgi:hypothetical protein